jgi:hypothetical protein
MASDKKRFSDRSGCDGWIKQGVAVIWVNPEARNFAYGTEDFCASVGVDQAKMFQELSLPRFFTMCAPFKM